MKSITSLYIHFPLCQHLCNYCDFYKHQLNDASQISDFENLLDQQFEFHQQFLRNHGSDLGKLETLYLGGGTPSLWRESGVSYIQKLLDKKAIELSDNCEFTLEVDPDTWKEEDVDRWLAVGVNRFSIGSQAFSDKYMEIMDRTHRLDDVEKTLKYFSDRNLNYSVDLMLGLPNSEDRELESELNQLLKYKPNHISVYILKTRKNYLLNDKLPSDDLVRDEYLLTSKILSEAGYDHYEVSNFARDGFYSKHNLKYWSYEDVAGIGPNATGLIVNDDEAIRYQWKSSSAGVREEVISGESLLIEKLFLGLRSKSPFNMLDLFPKPGDHAALVYLHKNWLRLGYLKEGSILENIQVSALGYLMCDSMIDDIFKQIEF